MEKNSESFSIYKKVEENSYILNKELLKLLLDSNIHFNVQNIKINFEKDILKYSNFSKQLNFYFRDMLSYYFLLFKKYDNFNIEKFFNRLQGVDIKKYDRLISIDSFLENKDIKDYTLSLDPYLYAKKIYSSSPYLSYKNYDNKKISEKISLLYEDKGNNENNFMKGGSCHNWTLLYISILENLNKILKKDITYKIVIFGVHSFLIFNYKNRWYYFDTNSSIKFYPQYLNIGDSIDIGNGEKGKILSIYPSIEVEIDKLNRKKGKIFRKKDRFIDYLDKKNPDYILSEYKIYAQKNLENFVINSLKIYIFNKKFCIDLVINGRKYNIKYKNYKLINYVNNNHNLTSKIIFNEVLKRTKNIKLLKSYKKDIDSFFNTISPNVLKKLILSNLDTKSIKL